MTDTILEPPRIRTSKRRAAAAKLPPAVKWTEGMLLAPQHFQLHAQRNEALLHFQAASASPFHWGLLELEREPLQNGEISIRRVEAVMPDGLVVAFQASAGTGATELSIKLDGREDEVRVGKRTTIYLCVASREPGERFRDRYSERTEAVADETTGRNPFEVQVLEPRLQLMLTDELLSSHVGIPIAKVAWKDGKIAEVVDYEPPWLAVRPESLIHTLCSREASRLRAMATSRARSIGGEWGTIEKKLFVYGLVSALPPFEALLDSGAAHPFALYAAFTSVLGHIAVGQVPEKMPRYDHDDPLPCFHAVQKEIGELLRKAVREPYLTEVFRLIPAASEFRLTIREEWIGCEMLVRVRIPQGRTLEQIHEWMMGSTIGSSSSGSVESLRKRRMSGVFRERVREHELLPMAGVIFYSIDRKDANFPKAGDELVIANASEGEEARPEEIVLYIRGKD